MQNANLQFCPKEYAMWGVSLSIYKGHCQCKYIPLVLTMWISKPDSHFKNSNCMCKLIQWMADIHYVETCFWQLKTKVYHSLSSMKFYLCIYNRVRKMMSLFCIIWAHHFLPTIQLSPIIWHLQTASVGQNCASSETCECSQLHISISYSCCVTGQLNTLREKR